MRGLSLFLIILCSCSDPGPKNDGGGDVNGCSEAAFQDQTDGGPHTITWDFTVSPKCMKIAVGQTVTFSGDFVTHPLGPAGGDSPNPIASTKTGTSVQFTFSSAGTYGFKCGNHGSMLGAVKAVP